MDREPAPRPASRRIPEHGGVDFYPLAQFADAVLRNVPVELDVYTSVETAAPAILASQSTREGGRPFEVPDFRPRPGRAAGQMPGE